MFGGWLSSGLLQTLNLAEARVLQGIYWSLLKEPTHQSSDALFGFKAPFCAFALDFAIFPG